VNEIIPWPTDKVRTGTHPEDAAARVRGVRSCGVAQPGLSGTPSLVGIGATDITCPHNISMPRPSQEHLGTYSDPEFVAALQDFYRVRNEEFQRSVRQRQEAVGANAGHDQRSDRVAPFKARSKARSWLKVFWLIITGQWRFPE